MQAIHAADSAHQHISEAAFADYPSDRNCTRTVQKQHRNSTKAVQKQHRNSTKTAPKQRVSGRRRPELLFEKTPCLACKCRMVLQMPYGPAIKKSLIMRFLCLMIRDFLKGLFRRNAQTTALLMLHSPPEFLKGTPDILFARSRDPRSSSRCRSLSPTRRTAGSQSQRHGH